MAHDHDKGYCQDGCYPVAGSGMTAEVDGEEFVIDDIHDLREYIAAVNASGGNGPLAAEQLIVENEPNGEPYVLPDPDEEDPIKRKIKGRGISISGIGQGFDMAAYLDVVDRMTTHYRFNGPIKVKEWVRATPQSQVHDELQQRRQQAEQQINRQLSSLSDLYEQKQLLEHDLRTLEERMAHFEADEDEKGSGGGYEDELKADFVDLVDQHTGRHSILQMQANNVFPSITADFYQMSSLDDLEDGPLKDLPENEKATLRKKWKLYERWKDQFEAAVRSRLEDVRRRLNSVEASIEQTENWIKPYVEDLQRIQGGPFDEQLAFGAEIDMYLPAAASNTYRLMKMIAWRDRSPGEEEDLYQDVVLMEPLKFFTGDLESPQRAGEGLGVFKNRWTELLVCQHVFEAVFEPQLDEKTDEIQRVISQFVGEPDVELEEARERIQERYHLTGDEEEALEDAATGSEAYEIEREIIDRVRPGFSTRLRERIKTFLGMTDAFYHPKPTELRRELMGPYFPTQFYLDYKYENGLYVMK